MARSFNGSAKIVGASVTPINFNYNNAFSVFGWFYVNSATFNNYHCLVGHLDPALSFKGWELIKHDNSTAISNAIYFQMLSAVGGIMSRPSNFVPTAGAWFNALMTYNGSDDVSGMHMYANGALSDNVNVNNNLGANAITNTIAPIIGSRSDNTIQLNGGAADVAVWNVALTANEAAALSKGLRPYMVRSSALVAYWPLDGLQSPEPDLSGNVNNGTLTGTALANGPPVNMFTPKWPINDVFPSTAPSFIPAWTKQSTLPVIGAGTY